MRMREFIRGTSLALTFIALALVTSACGNGQRQLSSISIKPPAGADTRAGQPAAPLAPEKLDDALAKLAAAPCPEGVDAKIWEELKGALKAALQERNTTGRPRSLARLENGQEEPGWLARRTQKITSTPPTTDGSRVSDLAFGDDGTGNLVLTWHYRNAGDYDQNGVVNIADVTPIAMHYGEVYAPANVNSALAVIDGSGNGVVDIADITPLAMNYGAECAEYALEDAGNTTAGFAEVARVALPDAGSGGRLLLSTPHVLDPARPFVRVVPYDSAGAAGVPSAPLKVDGEKPHITSIYPLFATSGSEQQFIPYASGDAPLYYSWDFGGGAEPTTTTEYMPTVTIAAPGAYSAKLTVRNIFGSEEVPFTLTTGVGPEITNVTPVEGDFESPTTFSADVAGTQPFTTYAWDFGGGAVPNTSTEASPAVTLGEMGDYAASVTVSSHFGTDTYLFNLHVLGWHIELVDNDGPVGQGASLALDADGLPHIAYTYKPALGIGNYLKYAYNDGTAWHVEVVDNEGETGFNPSLALDSFGYPHISYQDMLDASGLETNDLNYAYYYGSSWVIEIVDSEGDSGGSSSLAIDSLDRPHIAYDSVPASGKKNLKYAWYDGSAWNTEIVESSGYLGSDCSLALDSVERPHISYQDRTNGFYNLKYAYYDGAAWQIETVDNENGAGHGTSLGLDSLGHPHIGYGFYGKTPTGDSIRDIRYSSYDGLAWQIETLNYGGLLVINPSLAIDSQDYPHIALRAIDPVMILYTDWDGSNWRKQTVNALGGNNPSLKLDPQDRPHMCYLLNELLYYAAYY